MRQKITIENWADDKFSWQNHYKMLFINNITNTLEIYKKVLYAPQMRHLIQL